MNLETPCSPGATLMNKSCSPSSVLWWRSALIAVYTLSGAGCNLSDTGPSAYRPPDQYFAALALEHHAINLSTVAPYDTVTLRTARTMGDGSNAPGEVTYSVSDPSISITDGVLKAESPVVRAVLHVTLTYGTITRTDSAIVSVIATAPNRLRDFGLRVPAGDSAKTGTNVPKTIPLLRASESGSNLSTLLVSMVSSDSTVAAMTQSGDVVNITARRPGRVVLATSTFAFGTVWRDSLVFTVGWPLVFAMTTTERFTTGSVATVLDFGYHEFTIGVGGCVVWVNPSTAVDIDIQFDDPSHVGPPGGSVCPGGYQIMNPEMGGNIAPFRTILWGGDAVTEENLEDYMRAWFSPFRARVFSAPGVFPYRSTLHGTTGLVRVCDERNDTTCAPVRLGGWY